MLAVTPSPVPNRGPLSPGRSLGILTPNLTLPPVSPPTLKLTTCHSRPQVPLPQATAPSRHPKAEEAAAEHLGPGSPGRDAWGDVKSGVLVAGATRAWSGGRMCVC